MISEHLHDTKAPATLIRFQTTLRARKRKRRRKKKDKMGAIPKTTPDSSSLPEFSSGLQYDQVGTPPNTRDVIIRLQLVKDNDDREIRKLELPLQSAQHRQNHLTANPSVK